MDVVLLMLLLLAATATRLSPSDIHRLHASVTGTVVKIAKRGTRFMASEFAAVHSRMDIMVDNERLVMEFDTKEFGTVVQVRGCLVLIMIQQYSSALWCRLPQLN
jgi:phosphatidylserine decarboxylase